MAYRAAQVTQAEIKRTLQGALSAGLKIARIEVDHATGRVVVVPEGVEPETAGPDPDELLKK